MVKPATRKKFRQDRAERQKERLQTLQLWWSFAVATMLVMAYFFDYSQQGSLSTKRARARTPASQTVTAPNSLFAPLDR